MTWLITPEQTLSAARKAGMNEEALKLSGVAVLTFNKAVIDRMEELCGLQSVTWIGPHHHPYAAPELVKRGSYQGLSVTVVVPPCVAAGLCS